MIKKITLIFLAVFVSFENSQAEIWNSEEGLKRLQRSEFKSDFYQLVNFYQPQENPLFCSIATATMIRNAFEYGNILSQKEGEVLKPDGGTISYPLYSQKDFFNEETEKVKKRSIVEFKESVNGAESFDPGLSLGDFAKMLRVHNFGVKLIYVKKNDEATAEKFRRVLRNILNENSAFLVVNFDGKFLEKTTRGHISPIVAFDEESDSVLVLDVALHKNRWYWVEVSKLIEAMNTKDAENYRGYLMVSRQ